MPASSVKSRSGLRKRKGNLKNEAATATAPRNNVSNGALSNDSGLLYAFVFISIFIALFYKEKLADFARHYWKIIFTFVYSQVQVIFNFGLFYFKEFSGANEIARRELLRKYPSRDIDLSADVSKRDAVVKAFQGAWLSYERNAMGSDEFHPISQEGTNLTTGGGIGYTIIDALDTMKLMGLEDEFIRARKWIVDKLDFNQEGNFSTFECTIRVLGGLLSTYHLTDNDPLFLEKAVDLADRLLPAFDTPAGLPMTSVNLAQRRGIDTSEFPGTISTAEATSLQLEFRYLSHLTGNRVYWSKAEQVMYQVRENTMEHGLASIWMSYHTGEFLPSTIRLGSRADSHWEYLLKQYLQTNMKEPVYKSMYSIAMNAIHANLVTRSDKAKLTYISELSPHNDMEWLKQPRQEHLVCFFGGSLMLGAVTSGAAKYPVSVPPKPGELTPEGERDWETGQELIKTCMATHDTSTGLAPEVVWFRIPGDGGERAEKAPSDWYIRGAEPHLPVPYEARYLLRPETIESLFIAWRLTGDPRYRSWAWSIFESIQTHCRVPSGGYAAIVNVDDQKRPAEKEDKTESYMLSETLKYLFLIFEDGEKLKLDEYVLNTEAHPLPIFDPDYPATF